MAKRILVTSLAVIALGACPGPGPKTENNVPDNGDTKQPDTTHSAPPTLEAIFAKSCREGLETAQGILPQILSATDKNMQTVLEPYNEMQRNMGLSGGMAGSISEVHPNSKIRDAARECEQDVDKFATELKLNKDLFHAFEALDTSAFDADAKRLVEHTLRDFRRAGIDRDDATRKRIGEIDEELTKLGQEFGKNIVEDVRHISLDSVEDLKGLPQDFIDAHKPGDDGKIKITTDYPDYIPFISYAESTELRRQIYMQFKARGGEANEKVLQQILVLRAEKAKLLGYDTWADYVTEDKMIKSGKNAADFIEKVAALAQKRAARDYAELLKRKQKDVKAVRVEDYEKSYYENLVKKEDYDFDPLSVRPYFPYEQVEKGLLDITSKVYGVTYERVTDADVWHEEVEAFDVIDSSGKNLGRIYLDMHPREGKYKHAAQFPVRSGVAGKQLPLGALVCNFPNPKDGPALMEHGDVVTMFHEFGHLMHHIFGGHQKWYDQSGVATEWDFVEAPSQMFEEWAWDHGILSTFAKHHETGEAIPKDLVDRMRRADKFGLGVATVQQMFYAAVSLNFHTADPATLDMRAEVKRLQDKYTPFEYIDGTLFHANFGHLNGYSAIYYTYMWSLVIAKDLLTPFEKNGLMNTEWTYAYRDKILAAGGTKDAADLVEDFLGREYSFKAFEKYLSK